MKKINDKSIDLILTDPPYNAKNIGPNKKKYSLGTMKLPDKEYKKFCRQWFNEAKRIAHTIVFTPGIANTHNYPQPNWQIAWHKPASVSFNRYQGFNAWEPIFCYGKRKGEKRLGQDYILCNTLNFSKGVEKAHPCPKPPALIFKLVSIFSNPDNIIFDPMMGSGTTILACRDLKRQYIGIDINPEYCKIAEQRLAQQTIWNA